ncbi:MULTISPECIES: PHP domain-containing protein [Clostridium]|uniref:PHP domain-containing protein n=1 Tax=Clostridium TaxID=1485 RepID=UPI001FA919D4|nr:PHP domain-containing protein [Clostridium cagae]
MIEINKIDLHTHTNVSDGGSTPKELIEDAFKESVKAIALTDYDNIGGLKIASLAAKENGIQFLNEIKKQGINISVDELRKKSFSR